MTASTPYSRHRPNSQFRQFLSLMSCMPHTSSLDMSTSAPSSPAYPLTPDSPQNQPCLHLPLHFPTTSLTSPCSNSSHQEESLSRSPKLFRSNRRNPRQMAIPPPLPQQSPRTSRRHKLHNYASLTLTNGSYDVYSSVGTPPPNSPNAENSTTEEHS